MKQLLIGLAALLIVPLAGAEDMKSPNAGAAQEAPAAKSAAKATASKKKHPRATKQRLPGGDLRHCLERKTSEEIIKCSESR